VVLYLSFNTPETDRNKDFKISTEFGFRLRHKNKIITKMSIQMPKATKVRIILI